MPVRKTCSVFTVATGGTHVIDTKGPTDMVMKLFGPDSPTRLIAEDDDSGTGTNARIVAALIPGQYHVQLRHYRRDAASGSYTMRVHRPRA